MAETSAVKSADRVLAILGFVADSQPVRFSQLLTEFNLPRSSAHGLLQTMVARGWLEHDPDTRSYSLGLRAWQIGQRYVGHLDLPTLARPEMDRLAAAVGETVQMARLDGLENVYIAISEAPRPIRLASSVGARLPAYATGLGKALLAQLPPEEVRRRLQRTEMQRFTEHTLTGVDELMRVLADVRVNGYAQDDEEYLPGTCCVAVPLVVDKKMITSMSITAPTSRRDAAWPSAQLVRLRASATSIRTTLGLSAVPLG
jgi:IclR family acetate operon transcriptional repressor